MDSGWFGLGISKSPLVKRGTFIWRRGTEVIGIGTAERAEFLGMFGLAPKPPKGANNVILSPDDYLIMLDAAKPLPSPDRKE